MWQPIKGIYTYHEIQKSKWIIIFVHWLTSDQNEETFVQWEKFFNENWYSTIRFNLYWDLPGERKLDEACLKDNIDDVNGVLDFCNAKWYKKIFLVGHSYGWIVNLGICADVDGGFPWAAGGFLWCCHKFLLCVRGSIDRRRMGCYNNIRPPVCPGISDARSVLLAGDGRAF